MTFLLKQDPESPDDYLVLQGKLPVTGAACRSRRSEQV